MRKLLFAAAALFAAATLTPAAQAAPDLAIRVFQDNVLQNSLSVSSSGPTLSTNGATSNFSFVTVIAAGFPLLDQPELSVQSLSISSNNNFTGTSTIRLEVTQTGIDSTSARNNGIFAQLATSFTQNFLVGDGVTSVTSSSYATQNNRAFGTSTLIGSLSSVAAGGPTNSSGLITSSPFRLTGDVFSETVIIEATFNNGGATLSASAQIVGVPEPASLALFGMGLLGLGLIRQRRAKG